MGYQELAVTPGQGFGLFAKLVASLISNFSD